jgi:hypothetical protein
MPNFTPIDIGMPLQASLSTLIAFRWKSSQGIEADFRLPQDNEHLLRVSFDGECIIRLLDEMPLSTENGSGPCKGLVPEHLAYEVQGAIFFEHQSSVWKEINAPARHYQFITGWTCMDVVTSSAPAFSIVERS